jgi:hypothetical protein
MASNGASANAAGAVPPPAPGAAPAFGPAAGAPPGAAAVARARPAPDGDLAIAVMYFFSPEAAAEAGRPFVAFGRANLEALVASAEGVRRGGGLAPTRDDIVAALDAFEQVADVRDVRILAMARRVFADAQAALGPRTLLTEDSAGLAVQLQWAASGRTGADINKARKTRALQAAIERVRDADAADMARGAAGGR